MEKLTITEALAEVKTINKRLVKKGEFILTYLVRQEKFKDPLLADGGSPVAIQRELQSVKDLNERIVAIRRAIAKANAETVLALGGQTRSIADWLTWRREVAGSMQTFYGKLAQQINAVRTDAVRKNVSVVPAGGDAKPDDVYVNLSEQGLAQIREEMETILGDLDGKLSLLNATTFIEF